MSNRTNQILLPWAIFLFTAVFGVCFWLKALLVSYSAAFPAKEDVLFYSLNQVLPYDSFEAKITAFAAVILLGVFLFLANRKYLFLREKSSFLIFFLILLIGINEGSHSLNPGVIGLVFMLLAFVRFLGMFENRYSVWNSFDIGFYLSLGSLFFFEMIYYVPIFWLGYFLFQQFNIKTLIASFMGCLTPYALVAGIFFLTDNLDTLIFSIVQNFDVSFLGMTFYTPWNIASFALIIIIALISFVHFIVQYNNDKIKTRGTLLFVYLLLVFSIFLGLFSEDIFLFEMPLICLFLSIIFTHFFSINTSRFSRFVFYAFWVLSIIGYSIQNIL